MAKFVSLKTPLVGSKDAEMPLVEAEIYFADWKARSEILNARISKTLEKLKDERERKLKHMEARDYSPQRCVRWQFQSSGHALGGRSPAVSPFAIRSASEERSAAVSSRSMRSAIGDRSSVVSSPSKRVKTRDRSPVVSSPSKRVKTRDRSSVAPSRSEESLAITKRSPAVTSCSVSMPGSSNPESIDMRSTASAGHTADSSMSRLSSQVSISDDNLLGEPLDSDVIANGQTQMMSRASTDSVGSNRLSRRGSATKEILRVIPYQAVDSQIRRLMIEACMAGKVLPMTVAAAPAAGIAQTGLVLMLVFYILFIPVAMRVQVCPTSNTLTEFEGIYTPNWFLGLVYPIFIGYYFLLEWKCCTYVLPVQLQALGHFSFLGGCLKVKVSTLSFTLFVLFRMALSVSAHVGILSNGLFVARTLKEVQCESQAASFVEEIWQQVLEQSWLPRQFQLKLKYLILFAWWSKVFQFLHAFFWCYPVGKKDMHCNRLLSNETSRTLRHFLYGVCCESRHAPAIKVDYILPGTWADSLQFQYEYRALMQPMQNHGAAFQLVASVIKLSAVRALDFSYAVAKMRKVELARRCPKRMLTVLTHAQSQMMHAVADFLFAGICENMLFLHLQISITAIRMLIPTNTDATKSDVVPEDTFNGIFLLIVVNLMLSLTKFIDALNVIRVFLEVYERAQVWNMKRKASRGPLNKYRSMRFRFFRYLLYVALYMWLLFLAFAKVWAVEHCPCKLWNLWTGCASLEGTRATCSTHLPWMQ